MIASFIIVLSFLRLTSASYNSINFLGIGDWGGQGSSPYTTSSQLATAKGMGIVASQINSTFVVALGDNFYNSGIPVTDKGADSLRFADTWFDVYTADSLRTPWIVIAGNHDHSGNVTAQIAYSNVNSLWIYPDVYHAHHFSSDDKSVTLDLFMIDTIEIAGILNAAETDANYFDPLPLVDIRSRRLASSQVDWLSEQLAASTATYVIVGGHYPVYSVCEHGPTATLIQNVLPLLEKYQAHFIAGHDHCLEYIKEATSDVRHIVVGPGKECCYSSSNMNRVPAGSLQYYLAGDNKGSVVGGFGSFTATSASLVIRLHDQDGNIMYTVPQISPRK